MRYVLFRLLWEHNLDVPWFGIHNVPDGELAEKLLAGFERQQDGYDERESTHESRSLLESAN